MTDKFSDANGKYKQTETREFSCFSGENASTGGVKKLTINKSLGVNIKCTRDHSISLETPWHECPETDDSSKYNIN